MEKVCSSPQCNDLGSRLAILSLNAGKKDILKTILDIHGTKDIHLALLPKL